MNYINKTFQTQIEVKKSKFLSFLVPINEFKALHSKLKAKHPKANHIVWAYRELKQFKQIAENSSDDGEPKGGAGVPTLNAMRGAGLINCAIITVRYFGGIKLGVGGMARAYSASANEVINSAVLLEYKELIPFSIEVSYKQQRQIEYILKELKIEQIKRKFLSDKAVYKIKAIQEKIDKIKDTLQYY